MSKASEILGLVKLECRACKKHQGCIPKEVLNARHNLFGRLKNSKYDYTICFKCSEKFYRDIFEENKKFRYLKYLRYYFNVYNKDKSLKCIVFYKE